MRILAANATHGPCRGLELRFANVMACLLFPNHLLEPIAYRFVVRSIAQLRTQVVFVNTEQASAELPIRRKPDAIAIAAERLAHRGDNSNFATPIRKSPAPGGCGGVFAG
jgi:hypothetical protein